MCTCCINSRCGCAQDRICHVVRFWCASGTMQSASCQPTNWPTNVSALAWVLAHCMQTSKLLELRCREPSRRPPAAALRRCMRAVTPLLQWPPQKEMVSLQAMPHRLHVEVLSPPPPPSHLGALSTPSRQDRSRTPQGWPRMPQAQCPQLPGILFLVAATCFYLIYVLPCVGFWTSPSPPPAMLLRYCSLTWIIFLLHLLLLYHVSASTCSACLLFSASCSLSSVTTYWQSHQQMCAQNLVLTTS